VTSPRPPLDRVALERVLSRATQLQGQVSDEPTGALSDEQILELGKEVGLSPDALRQAIAEERGRVGVPVPRGIRGAWFGATTLSATRVVPGTTAAMLTTLDEIMRGELSFDVKRRYPDGMQWEPKRGFFDTMKSQLGGPNAAAQLRVADDIAATLVAVDPQRVHVRLDASMGDVRRGATNSSVGLASAGGVTGGILVGVLAFNPLFTIPPLALITLASLLGVRRSHHRTVTQAATALEQLLDRLEFGLPVKRTKGFVEKLLG
jgi:hypothetical protein